MKKKNLGSSPTVPLVRAVLLELEGQEQPSAGPRPTSTAQPPCRCVS